MKMKEYQLTQREYDEFCQEFEAWCDDQEASWGYTRADCQLDQEARANGYTLPTVYYMAKTPIGSQE